MLNGWGGYVLTEINYVNAFFSHDGYVDFFAAENESLDEVRRVLLKQPASDSSNQKSSVR